MSKKKRFGISPALTRGLSETINVVEHNAGLFRNVVLPLSRIELDPENPRKLALSLTDVKSGLKSGDPQYAAKQTELEKLKELAHTIRSSGVINPIVVYKHGEYYRVVAGERRCLASLLAEKEEIDARVFTDKPKAFELKLIQWIENTAREDLSLTERLENVRDILREYQTANAPVEVNASLLRSITGLSLSQASYYMLALNAPDDVGIQIKSGGIKNLDKAALLSSINLPELRHKATEACVAGASIKELRQLISHQKAVSRLATKIDKAKRGRLAQKIDMGSTKQPHVVKLLVESVVSQKKFDKYIQLFSEINWSDYRQAAKAFRKLVELLELEMAV